ncbi:MAG: C2H2-type zinc finger protein [Candidatus Babeliales bacterium]
MKKLFLLLSLLLSSNQLLVSAEQSSEQPQSSGSGKNTTCLICGKVFSKMSNLTRHMQGHTTANL